MQPALPISAKEKEIGPVQLQVLSPLPSRSAPPKAGGVGLRVLHGLLPPLFLPLRSFREILISDMMREFRGGNGGDRGRAWTKRQDRLVGDYLGPRDAPVDTLGSPGPQVCLPLLSTGGVLEIFPCPCRTPRGKKLPSAFFLYSWKRSGVQTQTIAR